MDVSKIKMFGRNPQTTGNKKRSFQPPEKSYVLYNEISSFDFPFPKEA
jgi:hypothetical protein